MGRAAATETTKTDLKRSGPATGGDHTAGGHPQRPRSALTAITEPDEDDALSRWMAGKSG